MKTLTVISHKIQLIKILLGSPNPMIVPLMEEMGLDTLRSDCAAAELYLKYWQADEAPDPQMIQPEIFKGHIAQTLKDMDYPNPARVCYDNESEPLIQWKAPDFDWTEWLEIFHEELTLDFGSDD